jgi:predicted RNase H-like HicB family nuclease
MTQHYHALLEWDPETGLWVTYVPALSHLSTFGETKEEALAKTREAILGYLEAAEKEGMVSPDLLEQKVAFDRLLTRYPSDEAQTALQDLLSARE